MAKATKKREVFTLVDPQAREVKLVGDFTTWEKEPIALKRHKDGLWKVTVPLSPGQYEYRFVVDGQWRDDNQCQVRRPNPFGALNCVREVSP
ncbi:MAG TPA: isoamylase early set domain-containing protein [Methylomirabilota bacterium]|nr:isoamylase early set domain-containing protein [Methylomirabilota bacterium]